MASAVEVVLDTETTGLSFDADRIIEIGCIKMVERRPKQTFHAYINPMRESSEAALKVHGITQEFLKDKPVFGDVYHDFMAFVDGATLVIHNASFDMGFLQAEINRVTPGLQLDAICKVVDTLSMARKMFPGQKNSLDALCERFGIDVSHRELHGALMDADLLVKVYLQMTMLQHKLQLAGDQVENAHVEKTFAWSQAMPVLAATRVEKDEHEAFMRKIQEA